MLSRLLILPQEIQQVRQLTQSTVNKARHGFRRSGTGFAQLNIKEAFAPGKAVPTLRERLLGPTTGKPFVYGTYALAGASAFGVGMLCYYGLTMSADSAAARAVLWPDYVRQRLHSTYAYLGGSLALTAGAGMAAARNQAILSLMNNPSLMCFKHLAWAAHCSVLGAILAPLCFMGGPALMRAAWYTAGVVGGLSATAICAPSEKFLNMAGPLAMGLGVVFVACLGQFAFPPNTALGAGLASVVVYGGLILFSAFLLHDTQRVIKMAEGQPVGRFGTHQQMAYKFDPINAQLSIYMDILNIFIRMAMIMGGGQRRK